MSDTDGLSRTLEAHLSVKKAKTASWIVRGFRVEEQIGMPLRAEVVVDAARPVDPATLLGDDATLTLTGAVDAPERFFHGVVLSATVDAVDPEGCRLTLVIASRLALLELQRNSCIFRETNVKKITEDLLKRVGFNPKNLDWRASPADKPMFVQRDERDYDFLYRLLAFEGLTYFSQHTEDAEKLVFVADGAAFAALGDDDLFLDRALTTTGERTVTGYRERQTSRPGATMTRDYDLRTPSQDLSGKGGTDPKGAAREIYFHPAMSRDAGQVKKRARFVFEQIDQDGVGGQGQSDWPAMELGRWIEISGHPRAQGELLIDAIVHEGGFGVRGSGVNQEQFAYRNEFRTVPKERPLRLAARTAPTNRPALAFITGPSGQELHGSEYGQVKPSFTWDRSGISDDRSADWARVGQLALGGSMIVPRVGFEVLTDNELDDPDRPLVTGHLYNGVAMPPYALPDGATRSSLQTATTDKGGGANEIRFHDTAGEEEIFINASHDWAFSAEHDASWQVGADETLEVGTDQTIKIGANLNQRALADRSLTVGAQQKIDVGGDLSDGVLGASSVTVGAMRSVTVGGDLVETNGATLDRTVGGLQVVTGIKGFDRSITGNSDNLVGAAWLEACAGSRASTTEASRVETVGALKSVKAKTIAISAEDAMVLTEGAETVKVGGDRTDSTEGILALTAGGGLTLKGGKNINIVGKSKITFTIGGTTIVIDKSSVKIKSPKVDLKNVKSLPSTSMHKSC